MSNVLLERYYFVLYDGALTLKMSKMALNAFCDKTLHMFLETLFSNFLLFKEAALPIIQTIQPPVASYVLSPRSFYCKQEIFTTAASHFRTHCGLHTNIASSISCKRDYIIKYQVSSHTFETRQSSGSRCLTQTMPKS